MWKWIMKMKEKLKNLVEFLSNRAQGEQKIFQIALGLYQSPEIIKPDALKKEGINVVIDLEGSFDENIASFLKHYLWVGGIKDIEQLPEMEVMARAADFGKDCLVHSMVVLSH
jgi:hypothetical protein